jgi:hypothetical protein
MTNPPWTYSSHRATLNEKTPQPEPGEGVAGFVTSASGSVPPWACFGDSSHLDPFAVSVVLLTRSVYSNPGRSDAWVRPRGRSATPSAGPRLA